MSSNKYKVNDRLEHARANYWILTFICGLFLCLLSNKLFLWEFDFYTLFYGVIFMILAFVNNKLSEYISLLKDKR